MKYKIRGTGAAVELGKDQFKAKGGEGSIYIVGDTVYKVCEPGKMIADGKFKELNALTHPRIVRPEDVILDPKGTPTGYTMRLVPGAPITLAQMLTRTYREREGVTPAMMAALAVQIHDGIKAGIHAKPGYLQVDGNQLNYMVTSAHTEVYFIDVNSYQTPSFPADAIMPNIRDWACGTNFTQLTDWYSYAIIAWYMFTGIHPFMHAHPRFPSKKTAMVDQMKAGVSILDKDADFPKSAVFFPFEDYIPGGAGGAYMQWFRAVLLENRRLAPPDGFQATLAAVAAKVREIVGSNNFTIGQLGEYVGQITGFVASKGREVVVTTEHLYVDNQRNARIDGRFRVAFTPKGNVPVALVTDAAGVSRVRNLDTGQWLPTAAQPFAVAAASMNPIS